MAAIVEQHHDESGIAWPREVAPYDVHVVALHGLEEQAEPRRARSSTKPGSPSCSTTATTCARARSSPTPT